MKKYNKYNKKYTDRTPENDKVVIASDEGPAVERQEEELDIPRQSPRNTEAFVSSIPSPHEDGNIGIKHEPELKGGFKALKDKGLRITNYQEYDP